MPGPEFEDKRDTDILARLVDTGMRRSKIAAMTMEMLDMRLSCLIGLVP